MRIRSDSMGQTQTTKFDIVSDQLERLRVTLAMDEKKWAEILDISVDDYAEIRRKRKTISIVAFARIADYLQLTLEGIINNQIDYQVLVARHQGDTHSLPERYTLGAKSKRRSSMNLLNATEEFLGWRARSMAMRHLQVTEAAFTDLNDVISLRFNTDLCDYLAKHYGGSHLFHQMGAYFIINNLKSPIGETLSRCNTIDELYEQFIEEAIPTYWEQNFHYRILNVTPTTIRAEGIPNREVAESLQVQNPGSVSVCQTKSGIVSSIPGYLGLPFAHVEEVRCVHRGDESCIYEIDFERSCRHLSDLKKTSH